MNRTSVHGALVDHPVLYCPPDDPPCVTFTVAVATPPPAWAPNTAYAVGDTVQLSGGAILTAVCCGLVVAPPINSGNVMWRRCISDATNTISSSDGVISPLRPTMSALLSIAACRILSVATITPRSTTS